MTVFQDEKTYWQQWQPISGFLLPKPRFSVSGPNEGSPRIFGQKPPQERFYPTQSEAEQTKTKAPTIAPKITPMATPPALPSPIRIPLPRNIRVFEELNRRFHPESKKEDEEVVVFIDKQEQESVRGVKLQPRIFKTATTTTTEVPTIPQIGRCDVPYLRLFRWYSTLESYRRQMGYCKLTVLVYFRLLSIIPLFPRRHLPQLPRRVRRRPGKLE